LTPELAEWTAKGLERHCGELPDRVAGIDSTQSSELSRLRSHLAAVFEMREHGELSSEEFQDRKLHYKAQIATIEAVQEKADLEYETRRLEAETRLSEAPTAYDRFTTTDDVHVKRYLSSLLAESYVLTLGNLEIKPHPVLDRIRTFEPSRSGPEQISDGQSGPDSSVWRRFRDDIRTWVSHGDEPNGLT